jgi:16S rRNA (guanine966-N2)-methyltransferase
MVGQYKLEQSREDRMRIVGGHYRGHPLVSVGSGDPAAHLRPTTDRVRESLFNLLAHGKNGIDLCDTRVLDVFAGIGALGLEALSRGASEVTFIENGPKALGLIKANLAKLGAEGRILRRNALRPGPPEGGPYDLAFMDPPYGKGLGVRALSALNFWLAPGALVLLEEASEQSIPEPYTLLDIRSFGSTKIHFIRFAGL